VEKLKHEPHEKRQQEDVCDLLLALAAVALGVVLVRLLVHLDVVALLVDAAALDGGTVLRMVNLALAVDRQLLVGAGLAAHKVLGQPACMCVCVLKEGKGEGVRA